MAISDTLRQKIVESGLPITAIAQATGVSHPIISRFLSSDAKTHRDIRLERTADKLAAFFKLKLAPDDDAEQPESTKQVRRSTGKRKSQKPVMPTAAKPSAPRQKKMRAG